MTKTKNELNVVDKTEKKIVEQNIDFPEFDEADLIRLDMNMIEYPLFSRNRKREKNQILKYFFNNDKSKYIEITPSAGDIIPGEFEKSVFISLTRILKERGYPSKFVTTGREILNKMDISESSKKKLHASVKDALIRMSKTSYEFSNTLYSSKEKKLIDNKTITKMIELNIITKIDLKDSNKYTEEDMGMYSEYMNDGRIKEIFIISFGNHFYDNIITKGYLVYSAPELLGLRVNGAAMDIYLLVTKLRRHDLYLKRGLLKLASSVGYKFDGTTNIKRTVKSIETACELLKSKELIKDFNIEKTSSWKTAYIEFYFDIRHNRIKQENFFMEKNLFDDIYISQSDSFQTENKNVKLIEYVEDKISEARKEISEEELEYVFSMLPYSIKRLKTSKMYMINSLKAYGTKRVVQAIQYTKANVKSKPFVYLKKAIEFNYGSRIEVEIPDKYKIQEMSKINSNENKNIYSKEVVFDKFNELNEKEQKLIVEQAINDSLPAHISDDFKQTMEKAVRKQFKDNFEKHITEWLISKRFFETRENNENKKTEQMKLEIPNTGITEHNYIEETDKIEKVEYVDKKDIKKYIDESIKFYAEIVDIDEDTIITIKKDIAKVILPLAIKNKLTKDKLEELIQNEINKL